MSAVDKNQAIIDYLLQCPTILNSPLYFNFINAQDDTNQIVTQSTDTYEHKPYIDGSVLKKYSFIIITYKSAADIAVVKQVGSSVGYQNNSYPNENVSDMAAMQALIDWIQEQQDLHNYPNFGEDCIVDDIYTATDSPNFDGIDEQVSPPLAVYSITIEVPYLDVSKKIWR